MHILPEKSISKRYMKGCEEKIYSYCLLALANLPVLKSVVITSEELHTFGKAEEDIVKKYLGSDHCMVRYLYKKPCHVVKNGGKIIPVSIEDFKAEWETEADLWLLEPSRREENMYCCNVSLNRQSGNLRIEMLGKGFDISDINKGKISPHEWVDIPYPICFGAYGDWWKWAKFHFCSQEEYSRSIMVRKKRLHNFNGGQDVQFDSSYRPAGIDFFNHIFSYVQQMERQKIKEKTDFYNLSCSCERSGRIIFWDIQTPSGKYKAYC